jgi:ubiquinone/menaquinone biosynthesis C-methylase UbiE
MWDRFNAKEFYNEVAEKYPEEQIVYGTLEGVLRKQFVLSKLSSFRGTLLDIGCNVGTYLKEYQNGAKIGVDLADKNIEKAKVNVPQAIFYVGSAEQLEFIKNGSVDNVLCTEVLEHIEHPLKAINEFYRVLNKDGHLLLTTPNLLDDDTGAWISSPVLEDHGIAHNEYFHTAFSSQSLKEMAEKVGFIVLEHGEFCKDVILPRYIANKMYSVAYRARRLSRRLNPFRNTPEPTWGQDFNWAVLWRFQILIHKFLVTFKLNPFVLERIPEGLNSYILAKK